MLYKRFSPFVQTFSIPKIWARGYVYRVESVVLFGSMLSDAARLGDVDLAIELQAKVAEAREFRAWCDTRRYAAQEQGRCNFEEPCGSILDNLVREWPGACAGRNRLGYEATSNFCQFGSHSLWVGRAAAAAECQSLQHNRWTSDWPGRRLSCAVPLECLQSSKRDLNKCRLCRAHVGGGNSGGVLPLRPLL